MKTKRIAKQKKKHQKKEMQTGGQTLHKLKSVPGSKISVASEYHVNESTIRFRLKTNKLTAKDFKKPWWKCVFSAETEAQLANLIAVVSNHGFSPTFREITNLAKFYIKMNKLENSQFKNG